MNNEIIKQGNDFCVEADKLEEKDRTIAISRIGWYPSDDPDKVVAG